MKLKYIGEEDEVTFREVAFPKGKTVDLSDNLLLAQKLVVLPEFEQVKPGRKANAENVD